MPRCTRRSSGGTLKTSQPDRPALLSAVTDFQRPSPASPSPLARSDRTLELPPAASRRCPGTRPWPREPPGLPRALTATRWCPVRRPTGGSGDDRTRAGVRRAGSRTHPSDAGRGSDTPSSAPLPRADLAVDRVLSEHGSLRTTRAVTEGGDRGRVDPCGSIPWSSPSTSRRRSPTPTQPNARVLLVLDAVRSERITWRAAAALGIAPDQLLELARVHGLPVVRCESSDLHEDLATLGKIERGRTTNA